MIILPVQNFFPRHRTIPPIGVEVYGVSEVGDVRRLGEDIKRLLRIIGRACIVVVL